MAPEMNRRAGFVTARYQRDRLSLPSGLYRINLGGAPNRQKISAVADGRPLDKKMVPATLADLLGGEIDLGQRAAPVPFGPLTWLASRQSRLRRQFQRSLERRGKLLPGGLVAFFQRAGHVSLRRQKHRHVGQALTHGHRLDVRDNLGPSRISRDRQRLVGRQGKVFVVQPVPDHLVDSLWIAAAGWEEVHDQQMNTGVDERHRLAGKTVQGMATV